jgi:hypothetical protein
MPRTFITKIDSERGDIPRSRYVIRLIETGIIEKEKGEREGHKEVANA